MKPYIHDNEKFMWNLTADVGRFASNSVASDVSYIQWYYFLAAAFPETPPDRKAIYSAVRVTGMCTGRDDDPLVQAILAHQRALNHPVIDGKVSVIPGSSGSQRIGGVAFFVLRLGARFATLYPHTWPRIDMIPGCPVPVALDVQKTIPMIT